MNIGDIEISGNLIITQATDQGSFSFANPNISAGRIVVGFNDGSPALSLYEPIDSKVRDGSVGERKSMEMSGGQIVVFGTSEFDTNLVVSPNGDIVGVGQITMGMNSSSGFQTTVLGHQNTAQGDSSTVGGGSGNEASGTRATISGGTGNRASGYYDGFGLIGHVDSSHGTIGGGSANVVEANYATIGGGAENAMVFQRGLSHNTANADYGVIGGGRGNRAARPYATVAGGYQNAAGSLGIVGQGATVGGGMSNSASGTASVVPGGRANAASGDYSFAGGYRAKVTFGGGTPLGHHGTFVWADASDFDFNSVSANEFAVRSTGGVRFVTSIDGGGGAVNSVRFDSSGNVIATGTFNPPSDVNVKTAFSDVDGLVVLQRVLSVPVRTWVYKSAPAVRHIGPTAQDFRAAFDVGLDDKHIATVDADGVALAAIQGMNAKFDAVIAERDARIVKQDQEIAELKRAVGALLARRSTAARVDDGR